MKAAAGKSPAIARRYLQVSSDGARADLKFVPSTELTAGSAKRARQAIARVKSELQRLPKCEIQIVDGGISARIEGDRASIAAIAAAIDGKLEILRSEKLTGKMVEEILHITSEERRRWTKDGRLPSSGKASFKQGRNQVSLPLYAPDAIAALAQSHDVLQSWRAGTESRK